MKNKECLSKNNKGSALIFTIFILFILSVLGSVLISVSMTHFTLTKRSSDYNTVYYLADGLAEELIATMEVILANGTYEVRKDINAASSLYITEIEGEPPTYLLDSSSLGNDAFNDLVAYIKTGTAEDDGIEEIAVNDLGFVNAIDSEYATFSILSPISYSEDNEAGTFEVVITIEAVHNDLTRRIQLVFSIFINPTFIQEDQIESDVDNVKIISFITGDMAVSWREANLNE